MNVRPSLPLAASLFWRLLAVLFFLAFVGPALRLQKRMLAREIRSLDAHARIGGQS